MQAEGAAPPVEQAEQQERGPRQRGVSHRQQSIRALPTRRGHTVSGCRGTEYQEQEDLDCKSDSTANLLVILANSFKLSRPCLLI